MSAECFAKSLFISSAVPPDFVQFYIWEADEKLRSALLLSSAVQYALASISLILYFNYYCKMLITIVRHFSYASQRNPVFWCESPKFLRTICFPGFRFLTSASCESSLSVCLSESETLNAVEYDYDDIWNLFIHL